MKYKLATLAVAASAAIAATFVAVQAPSQASTVSAGRRSGMISRTGKAAGPGCVVGVTELSAVYNPYSAEQYYEFGRGYLSCGSVAFRMTSHLTLWERAKAGNWVWKGQSHTDTLTGGGTIHNTVSVRCRSSSGRLWKAVEKGTVTYWWNATGPYQSTLYHWGCEA